ncbi:MAG: hypothetical protein JRJ84_20585, partial [Deltaproteobacteria bacterium]|nr:hypothetical protein [Deltaproteobacteria bacterium]
LRPVLLATTLLVACNPENEILERPITDDIAVTVFAPEEDPVEIVEMPRFYMIDVPYAPAVSDDGTVLLFDWRTGGDVYLWTEEEGLDWVTTTGAYFNSVKDISADGETIIGSYGNYMIEEDTQAATWTEDDGWTKLGALPDTLDCPMQSSGWSLTADGESAVGLAFEGCSAFAFRWDESDGMVPFEQVGNGGNRASRVSRNGALTVGFAQGDYSRTPAVWYADGSGEVLNMGWTGEFYGVNADGTLAVGQFGTKAALWSPDEGHRFLGLLGSPGQSNSTAYALCGPEDEIIIGTDTLNGGTATAWTEETGLVPMQDFLEDLGMEFPSGTRLTSANACTPDKTVFVGAGGTNDDVVVWVAILPEHVFETPEN